jgi:hypothetical protein
MSWADTISAEPVAAEATDHDPHSSWVLHQEPHEQDQAAPRDEREHDGQEESFSSARRLEVHSAAMLGCIAISQVAWMGALAYFAHRLLF